MTDEKLKGLGDGVDEFGLKVLECVLERRRFVLTRGPLNPDVALLGVLSGLYSAGVAASRGEFVHAAFVLAFVAYLLIWFSRHVAVFVPPYDQREAADKLNRVTRRD